MDRYRVEIAYRTKRGGVCVGMFVHANDEAEAKLQGEIEVIYGRPARKFMWTKVGRVLNPESKLIAVSTSC